jgi:hypothetical protein
MLWQSIETYPLPTIECDLDYPKALFYSPKTGIVIGRCTLWDIEDKKYSFQYDCDGFNIEPTHWMPLPPPPSKE